MASGIGSGQRRVNVRGRSPIAVGAVAAGLVMALSAPVSGLQPPIASSSASGVPDCRVPLGVARNGSDAVAALDGNLVSVAARNGVTGQELAAQLRSDPTLWVSECGDLFFKDELPPTDAEAPATLDGATWSSAVGGADALRLHSRPGSERVLYLDFDGHYVSGTGWNATYAIAPWWAPAFTIDDDPTTFSDAELSVIAEVWQRVAQDYAPFDVDVTTEDPGDEALNRVDSADTRFGMRVLISPDATSQAKCGCAGVAWVDSFDRTSNGYHQPAFVYSHRLFNSAKYIAEAASHEAGHTLSLAHDGTSTDYYFSGSGEWGPIMGSPYSREITQWSDGSYADSNNDEDDLAKISDSGAPLVADDAGDTLAEAMPLALPADVSGLISTPSDVDAFTVSASGGQPLIVSVRPYLPGPDLDVSLTLMDSRGRVLAVSAPAFDTAAWADSVAASLSVAVPAGLYTVLVEGTGNGLAGAPGDSDYGSLGWYTLAISDGTIQAPPQQEGPSPSPTATDSPSPSPSPTATDSPSPSPSDPAVSTKKTNNGKGGGGGRNK